MLMIDLFCGRGGWSKAFLRAGWDCRGYDLVRHRCYRGKFVRADVLTLTVDDLRDADFVCCSSPCEQFSVHGMKHFHPNPPFPALGIQLFEHARNLCERSGVPYVMENVRAAQKFVGRAVHHCGPFYLWGNAVPPLMPQGIKKSSAMYRGEPGTAVAVRSFGHSRDRKRGDARLVKKGTAAVIPFELAACVVDFAGRLIGSKLPGMDSKTGPDAGCEVSEANGAAGVAGYD